MTLNKLKDFMFTSGEDEDDEEELEETVQMEAQQRTQSTSRYEPTNQSTINTVPSDAQMVLFEPRSFDEASQIATYLKSRKACVVNLHRLQREFSQRTIDFLTGVVFALDGSIQKIGHNVILCTPKDVKVTGDISLESDDE